VRKLGRNDPCHCGSGKKYKKCCLARDEANSVTRIVGAQDEPALPTVAEYVEHQLEWRNVLHQLVARHFVNKTIGQYEEEEIVRMASLWNEFSNATDPLTKKAGVYPAALEYVLCQAFGYEVTQNELAAKYGVSAGVISQRAGQLMAFAEQWSDEQEESPAPAHAPGDAMARISMERSMREMTSMLEEQDFDSMEEASAFISRQMNKQTTSGRKKKSASKKDQALDLIFKAMEEPDLKKRAKMAQDALLLDPDCADAFNVLAESSAATVKEMAYYYEQGMRAGERELGEEGFKEYKGHFWGYLPTRPYMRAKKGFADACLDMHNVNEAIKQYKELLELNPGDNQGVRYTLLLAYQEAEDWGAADALIREYNESSAVFNFSKVVIEYGWKPKSPKLPGWIKDAHHQNKHVIPLLLGKTKLPPAMPDYYGIGDKNEAVMYVHLARHLWQARPELLQLLRTSVGK